MSKFTFVKEPYPDNRFDSAKVTIETDAVCLDQILHDFQDFLRACGFSMDGVLEFVSDPVDNTHKYVDESEDDTEDYHSTYISENGSECEKCGCSVCVCASL